DWDGALLHEIDWQSISKLGEERDARSMRDIKHRVIGYRNAARMYHRLSHALRGQGLATIASTFRWREQLMERKALYWSGQVIPWLLSFLLDFVAGYGERPLRTLVSANSGNRGVFELGVALVPLPPKALGQLVSAGRFCADSRWQREVLRK